MRKDKMLFVNGLMRIAAYAALAFACAGEAWGRSIAKPNPAFLQWQKEHKLQGSVSNATESAVKGSTTKARLLSAATSKGEILIPDDDMALGYMPTVIDKSYLRDLNVASRRSVQVSMGLSASLPERFDLRDHERVTSVKNQGSYGTCWSHATMASIESYLLHTESATYDLSEKQLAQNHDWDMGYEGFSAGGNGDIAASFLTQWRGPILEVEDPYPDNLYYNKWHQDYTNGNIYALNSILPKSPNRAAMGHIQQIRWIPAMHYSTDQTTVKNELIAIKQALMEYGALYADYFHCKPFYKDYDGKYQTVLIDGVLYYDGSSWMDTFYFPYERTQYKGGGHAVSIVGWDDNFSKYNFRVTPPGNGALIVKNSWGASFGMDGYFYVSYYDRYFAKGELISFSGIEPQDNYSSVYQYDPMGNVRPWSPPSSVAETAWGANIFTATNSEPLAAVGFYAFSPNTSYQINVYVGCETGKPVSGSAKLTQNGITDYAGYVTVPLSSIVAVGKGKRFSIVLKLTTAGVDEPLALEGLYYYETQYATANEGESFVSADGKTWADLTKIRMDYGSGTYNFCCKAYTLGTANISLSSIEIDGPQSIVSGQSAQFTCEATYSDGSKKDVTSLCSWSIARAGQNYAMVSSTGLVTAKTVSSQQSATVQASYTEGGVKKDATFGFYVTIAAPDAPTNVMASQGTETSCVRVNWTAPSGATEYAVYRATANNSKNAQYVENVTVARYSDTFTVPGVDYWYFIKAKNSSGTSGFSAVANGWRKLSPPESVTASDTLLDKVSVSWSEVEGAKYYRVYRAESMEGEKSALGDWQTATAFDDTTATPGVTYFYYVVAAVDANGNRPSDYSIVEDGMIALPVTVDYLEIKGDASIVSGGNADYTADAIYTDKHRAENITPDSWSIASGGDWASVSGGRVTANIVTENKKIVLRASFKDGDITATGEKEIAITAVKPAAPRNVVATAQSPSQGVTLTWSAVAGAASYVVYRDGSVVGRVIPNAPSGAPDTTYIDSTAIPGVAYTYSVSAANGAGESERSDEATATVPLVEPSGVTATSDRTDGVLVLWRRVGDNALYHRVARATSADGDKTEIGTWTTETSYLDTSAVAETKYWYFVRAATSAAGANASDWSVGVVGRAVPNAPTLLSIAISGPDKIASSGVAVYSCIATYDDNTTESLIPNWSASGAGTIDSNGKLTASTVSVDATVTIEASHGGKTDAKMVKVVAPAAASASVSNIAVKPRWPFSSLVDIDYTLTTSPEGTKALITVSGQDDDHNVPLAAKTLTGDGASGAVVPGEHRITWDLGADHPGFHAKVFDVNIEAVPYIIGVPENVTATHDSSAGIAISWDAVEDAVGYEIWRSDSPVSGTATNIVAISEGTTFYNDSTAEVGPVYFYWIKTVGEYGVGGFSTYAFGYRLPQKSGTAAIDANGGTASVESISYTVGSPYGTLPSATLSGYDFVGWFTASDGGVEVTVDTIASDGISTLYAHWTPKTYTIHFSPNGGEGAMADMVVCHGVGTNLSANAFSNTNCRFGGWATNATSMAVSYVDCAGIVPSGSMTLYAVWIVPLPMALDNESLSFDTGGDAEWFSVLDDSAVNSSAAKSGYITDSESTWLRTTVVGKGTLSYRCKTSCENTFDKLTLTIDGRQYGIASGYGSGYNTLSYSVTNSGTHTVVWTYSKDASVSRGDDSVWIDNVAWTPVLFSASSGTSTEGVELEWESVANASTYLIWRSDTTNRTDAVVVSTAGASATRYIDTSALSGVQYRYWLQALTTSGAVSDVGGMSVGWRNFTAPTNFTATQGVYTNYVWLKFDAPTSANFYEFYMSQTNSLSSAYSIGYVATTNDPVNVVVSSGIEVGAINYFWVRACYAVPNSTWYTIIGTGPFSDSAMGYIKKYYTVTFDANGGEGDMPQQDVLIGSSTNLAANAFARSGYVFQGWATNSNGAVVYNETGTIAPTSDMTLYAGWEAMAPSWVSATDGTSSNEVVVTWAAVASATSYEVWRGTTTDPGAAVCINTLAGNSYSDSTAVGGTRYYYWIKTICNGVKSDLSTAHDGGWRKMYTPAPTFKGNCGSVTNILISWADISGAIKYQVYRSTTESSLGSLIAEPTTKSYADTSISANIYYYYSVRAVGSMATTASSSEFGKVRAYAGTYPHHSSVDVSSLRSVLTKIGHRTQASISGKPLNIYTYGMTNDEIGQAMTTPSIVDLDGNTASVSDKEQLVFGCIYDCWQKGYISGGVLWNFGSSDEARYKCERVNDFIVALSNGTATCRTLEASTNLVASSTNTGVRVVYNRNTAASQPMSSFVLVYRTDVAHPIGIMDYEKLSLTSSKGSASSALANLLANLNRYGYVFTDTTAVSGKTYTYYVRVYSYEYGISPKSKNATGTR